MIGGTVLAVCADGEHRFSKQPVESVHIVAGLGVQGDAHSGQTIKHRSRVAVDPSKPNLRQVHLIHGELLDELVLSGFQVRPGDLGENVLTRGIDLLDLPRGTRLQVGEAAVVELTGLRNPCAQIERFRTGLLAAVLDRNENGDVIRKAGVMAIALSSGTVRSGDPVTISLPSGPYEALRPV